MLRVQTTNQDFYKRINNSIFKHNVLFDIAQLDLVLEPDLFNKAIDHIKLDNGTFKTTIVNRFLELDAVLLTFLNSDRKYTLHDIGVSDGTTSSELVSKLNENKLEVSFLMSDKYSRVLVSKFGPIRVYRDLDNKLIYASVFGIIANSKLSWRFAISKILGFFIPFALVKTVVKETSLLNPSTVKYLDNSKVFFKEADIFIAKDMEGSFDIIRCMNVLNRSYFDDERIKLGLTNLKYSIKSGGILIIGRTDVLKSKNYASIFRVHNSGVEEIASFGGGSEVADLVFTVFGRVG